MIRILVRSLAMPGMVNPVSFTEGLFTRAPRCGSLAQFLQARA